ncbi:meiosis-specific nuclear structural protein 1 [Episyrphus balteatus]|uniref:meiosis-specific nuclear structural protein 1 n=1 Tax=Episyrphus balteatus TaxID=286459 RepID=UPI0024854603|nr:meiosis-specific nuclear structural protein 1 [Episyrphus balteatus]
MEHYEFISKTDKKSLFNQIKFLVSCGQESYQNDLATRRRQLRELLENEEKVYENEFIEKIKSRVDENIRQRQKSLMTMKEERKKEQTKFVASKKLHQNMLNCHEIREELRKKDYRQTQLCQLEQIDDKLRAKLREKKDEEFWLKVQKKMQDKIDQSQEKEDKLKRSLQANQCRILGNQLEEIRKAREMDLARTNKEMEEMNLKMKTSQGDEQKQALEARKSKSRDVKNSLNTICEQQKLIRDEAENFENVFHKETMRQVNEEIESTIQKNVKFKEETSSYLEYIKKFKNFAANKEKKRSEMGDELDKRFYCFKNHPKKSLAANKRHIAESSHKTLLKQICEEKTRRFKLVAAERENKMLENRFVKMKIQDRLKERLQVQKDLDDQIAEINRLKNEKQKQFENELNRAEEDQLFCEQLLEKHKLEGCDYLNPHPNWKLMACFKEIDG